MKLLLKPVHMLQVGPPIEVGASMLKRDVADAWFRWLGILTNGVVKEFNRRASVEFVETAHAYHITVRVREVSK